MSLVTKLFLGALVMALLGACSSQATPPPASDIGTTAPAAQTAPATGAYPGPEANAAYPGPDTSASSAYPGPGGAPPEPTVDSTPLVVPQPSSDQVGVTTGTLIRDFEGVREPMAGARLFLGTLLQTTEGVDAGVQVDRASSPLATTNGLGQFMFVDLPPGRYGLMLDAVEGTLLLNDPATGSDFVIEVEGGQVIDLGEIAYPFPELN